jgi:mRNA interferase YafQ
MRTIERTSQFKKDYRRESKGQHRNTLTKDFLVLVTALIEDQPLPERCHDHALTGEWKDHRDCHIKPDLVLIYRKPDEKRLQLVRLGSHAELSL